jgi:hypothetical protein
MSRTPFLLSLVVSSLPLLTLALPGGGVALSEVLNENGHPSLEPGFSTGQMKELHVEDQVKKWLVYAERERSRDAKIKVRIVLDLGLEPVVEEPQSGTGLEIDGEIIEVVVDGHTVSPEELEVLEWENSQMRREERRRLFAERTSRLTEWALRHGLSDRAWLKKALSESGETVTLLLRANELRRIIESGDDSILGIELYRRARDDVHDAMQATNVSTAHFNDGRTTGNGVGIYMTEGSCPHESRLTNYDRLSGSETAHSRNVAAILRTVSPDSHIYCRAGTVLPFEADLDGANGNPEVHIVTSSNSWYYNDEYKGIDRDWDDFVYKYGIPVFNSGGNQGEAFGFVGSPGKGLNIITVGDYDNATNRISPSSPYRDPRTGNDKPEIVAPGTDITAGGFTMSGTSQSTPHAAGVAADMLSENPVFRGRPYLLKAKLLAGATDRIQGGYDKVGLGGIDYLIPYWPDYEIGRYWWHDGDNSSFHELDARDGKYDGNIEIPVYISLRTLDSGYSFGRPAKVRAVLSWLTRGKYTFLHRDEDHPIGTDLDLYVLEPSGAQVGASASWDNAFEWVEFTVKQSGWYKFRIRRYANRDTDARLRVGLYVNSHFY